MPSLSTIVALSTVLVLALIFTRRILTSLGFTAYVAVAILIASLVKQAYLDMPLTFADFHVFMLAPAENLKLFYNYSFLGIEIAIIVFLATALVFAGTRYEPPTALLQHLGGSKALRTVTLGACLLFVVAAYVGSTKNARAERANDGDAYAAFFAMEEIERPMGVVQRLNFFFDNRNAYISLPPQRDQKRFQASSTLADIPDQATSSASSPLPDMLVVLEESTFDPELIERCKLAVCKGGLMQPPAGSRTLQGPLLVHTTGGGTWLSEFAFLSGFDWRVFGRGGAFAPVSITPRLRTSLPKYLKSLGYRTVGIYPVDGNFLSAETAYKNYGFDEFYSAQDFGFSSDWHKVRDADVFANALQRIERSEDHRPVFAFVLTIRNHGPHGFAADATPPAYRAAETQLNSGLADYLARFKDSGDDFTALRDKWLHSPHRRVIGWFGDHQPETAWNFINSPSDLSAERLPNNVQNDQLRYLTYYQFSANYDGPSNGISRNALDISYLHARLLEFAGLPLDAGASAGQETASACVGLLNGCADTQLVSDYLSYRIYQLHAVE